MIIRCIKNLIRLPTIYLTFLLIASLSVTGILISISIGKSCITAKNIVNDEYKVSLNLSLKQKFDYVYNETSDKYIFNDVNESLIDDEIIDKIKRTGYINDTNYYTNSYFIESIYILPKAEFENVKKALENGDDIPYFNPIVKTTNGYEDHKGVVGVTNEKLLYKALDFNEADLKITYLNNRTFNEYGVLLPKTFYDAYNNPDELVIGWFTGLNIFNSESSTIPEHIYEEYEKILDKNIQPPELVIPVLGYYDDSINYNTFILCGLECWKDIYSAYDYYNSNIYDTVDYKKSDIDIIPEIGIKGAVFNLSSPYNALPLINKLIDEKFNFDDYQLVSNDYNYKYAIASIESVEKFVSIFIAAVIIFNCIIILILLRYGIKKRRNEIYILTILGFSKIKILFNFLIETSMIIIISMILGLVIGNIAGNSICYFINEKTFAQAQNTEEEFSRIYEFMKNSDEIKKQISDAKNSFKSTGIELTYNTDIRIYNYLTISFAVLFLYSFILYFITINKNIIKMRE